ncbi:peptidoglycan recognition family protein [Lachnospiraceae bacterium 42-17]|nr:N-acetylmuramoyl-L-alanine amidase [Dorea sp.]
MKKKRRYKKKLTEVQRKRQVQRNIRLGLILLGVITIALGLVRIIKPGWFAKEYFELDSEKIEATKPEIDVELLTVNEYSRPGTETEKITGIVVHYTANPGATAMDNRNYFEGLKDTHTTSASSNFIVGLKGEIVQCVPTWEVAYASNSRNIDTVSIECCHPDESGVFTDETYRSMVQLCSWLCLKFDLDEKDVIRHYDVTEKNCPKYFVENEEAWEKFREDIKAAIKRTK